MGRLGPEKAHSIEHTRHCSLGSLAVDCAARPVRFLTFLTFLMDVLHRQRRRRSKPQTPSLKSPASSRASERI